jgi:hypothetical protein
VAPAQELAARAVVVLLEQGVLGEVGRGREWRRMACLDLLPEAAADGGCQRLVEKMDAARRRLLRAAVAQREVELGVLLEIGQRILR